MAREKKNVIVLDNVRSVHNVGSVFRTADTCGVSKIYLAGITPAPKDRFGRERRDLTKVSLGAERSVDWEVVRSAENLLKDLKKQGFYIVALEQAKNSVDYKKIKPKAKTAFVFGNEVQGLPKSSLKLCDTIAEIPMKGKKESLNVAVAVGVSLFRILGI